MDATAILPLQSLVFPLPESHAAAEAEALLERAATVPEEQELMARIARRDSDAFSQLYRSYERRIFNYLLRLASERALAEDLLQETFTRVWLAAHTWDSRRGTARAWIYTIALNTARTELRRPKRRVPHVNLDDAPGAVARATRVEPAVTATIDDDARAQSLRAALARLPDHQREVVTLRCQEQLGFAEIAVVTGAPVGTVKSRFHRAVAALRSTLGRRLAS